MIALTVSWIPLVADYTRFSRTRRAAFWGAGLGYLLPDALPVRLRRDPRPLAPGDRRRRDGVLDDGRRGRRREPARAARADRGRDRRGVRERLLDRRLAPERRSRASRSALLIVGVATLATAGALAIDLTQYPQFLFLLGGVLRPALRRAARGLARRGRHYTRADIFAGPAFRPGMIAAWLAGFCVYEWLAQTQGLGFWTDFWSHHTPPSWLPFGASLPCFVVTFALALAVSLAARERVAAPAEAG